MNILMYLSLGYLANLTTWLFDPLDGPRDRVVGALDRAADAVASVHFAPVAARRLIIWVLEAAIKELECPKCQGILWGLLAAVFTGEWIVAPMITSLSALLLERLISILQEEPWNQ